MTLLYKRQRCLTYLDLTGGKICVNKFHVRKLWNATPPYSFTHRLIRGVYKVKKCQLFFGLHSESAPTLSEVYT